MADRCNFCSSQETNMLILNGGEIWIEFCKECGDVETLTNCDGKTYTLAQVFSGDTSKEAVMTDVMRVRSLRRLDRDFASFISDEIELKYKRNFVSTRKLFNEVCGVRGAFTFDVKNNHGYAFKVVQRVVGNHNQRIEAKRKERDAKRNSIGNMHPELEKLLR